MSALPQPEDGEEGPGARQDLAGADRKAGRDWVRLGHDHDAVGREL